MMSRATRSHFVFAASALALTLLVAGCTKGGQFDPTEMFNSDMFDSKKKLKGERAPVFPEGVPGATSGVPADLVKGYQPPPEPADADAAVPGPTPPAAAAEAKPKPKPKPKPKVAAQKPPASSPTRINIGAGQATPAQQAGAPAWPAPPPTSSPQSQASQSVWPASPQSTSSTRSAQQPAPSVWPDPPSSGGSSR